MNLAPFYFFVACMGVVSILGLVFVLWDYLMRHKPSRKHRPPHVYN